MKPPDPPSDRDIQDAFLALDGTIPDGHLDDFSSRVLARLDEPEAGAMDSRELARGSGVSRPDEAAIGAAAAPDKPLADENSGLHEIKALASTTRRRISQKITSESEAEESLLVGATSGSFRAAAAARPDPVREKPADVRPIARAASEVDRRSAPSRASSAPFWVLGGVATAAAVAAVAVFVFGVGRTAKEADKAAASDVVARAESPAADQGAVTGTPADVRFAEPPPPAAQPAAGALAPAESAPAADEKVMAEGDGAGRAGASARPDQHVATSKSEPARELRKGYKETAKKAAPGGKSDGKDLNDVLNDVTGGVQAPAKQEEAAPKKPSKKELDRGDVARAMGAVRSSVMRCRDKEQFEGTVTVKFHVAPSGEVTAAEATGSKAGTPTGNCVAAAVKKAKFPAFDGAPTSFTYPFLLAE
jgi:hypothetical protein